MDFWLLFAGQVDSESVSRSNELAEMREKLEARKCFVENMGRRSKLASEDVKKQEESLSIEVRSLLVAGTALSKARKRLQVIISSMIRRHIRTFINICKKYVEHICDYITKLVEVEIIMTHISHIF